VFLGLKWIKERLQMRILTDHIVEELIDVVVVTFCACDLSFFLSRFFYFFICTIFSLTTLNEGEKSFNLRSLSFFLPIEDCVLFVEVRKKLADRKL
jgi:hypothetical protein